MGWNCVTGGYVCHLKCFVYGTSHFSTVQHPSFTGAQKLFACLCIWPDVSRDTRTYLRGFTENCTVTFRCDVRYLIYCSVLPWKFEELHTNDLQCIISISIVLVSKWASIHNAPISAYQITYLFILICSRLKVCTFLNTLIINYYNIMLIIIGIINYSVLRQKETKCDQSRLKNI